MNVLIVDDNATNLKLLRAVLEAEGHTVSAATDGVEALATLARDKVDAVISDILMPRLDGYGLCYEVRTNPRLRHLPFIIYTATYTSPSDEKLSLDLGADKFLRMPTPAKAIAGALAEVMQAPRRVPKPIEQSQELPLMKEYNDRLVAKLEEKTIELSQQVHLAGLSADVGMALITADTLRHMLARCAASIVTNLDAASARIWTLNDTGDVLELQASAGLYTHLDGPRTRVPVGTFRVGLIAQERKAYSTNEFSNDPRVDDQEWVRREGMVAFAGYPLLVADRLIGVAALFARQALSDAAMQALAAVADQIALGIDRKHAEGAMRAAQQRLQHVVASSPALLFTLAIENDRLRGISWMSDNVLDQLGYTVAETLGADWWMGHIHPDDVDNIKEGTRRDLFANGFTAHEYRFQHRDGSYRWVRSEIRLLRDAAGKPMEAVGSWSDITERKSLEEQYRQAQKMEAVGRLAGGVAHDFNNLLTVIMGYSDIYLAKLGPEDPLRMPLTEIRKAGERAAALTRQLLAFSRKQVLMPVVLDLGTIIADMAKMLPRLIGEDVALTVIAGPDLWQTKADPGQMEQVVMNIIVNARDAMPQGGRLLLETRNVELDARYAMNHGEAKPGEYVLLAISDTGCGMDASVKARIFEPFFTTKGPTKGTGLGLATVFGIVKQSGGHIEVYSEVGQGTTFKIYLPRDKSGEPIATLHRTKEPVRGGKESILLVEDENGVRALAKAVLQKYGYTVLDAPNGGDALLICETHATPIDLMITDVVMPNFSGRQLAERLALRQPTMKVLFMSGYTDDAIVHHGVLESGMPFLQKPFAPEALARKVREVLDAPPARHSVPS